MCRLFRRVCVIARTRLFPGGLASYTPSCVYLHSFLHLAGGLARYTPSCVYLHSFLHQPAVPGRWTLHFVCLALCCYTNPLSESLYILCVLHFVVTHTPSLSDSPYLSVFFTDTLSSVILSLFLHYISADIHYSLP